MKTTITNAFTGYSATIRTTGKPAVATVRKHILAAKASDCQSTTIIEIDGVRHDLIDLGNGPELRA
jgi:hypothetical protein